MEIWHITIGSLGRHPLVSSEAERRAAVHLVGRVVHDGLLSFCISDTHLHLAVATSRKAAGQQARSLSCRLRTFAGHPMEPARFTPVESRNHMENLLAYLLNQPVHHGLDVHPALWAGSAFSDLVGARCVQSIRLAVRSVLPRLTLDRVYQLVKLPGPPQVLELDALAELGAERLVQAAGAALAVGPSLSVRTSDVGKAQTAVTHLARELGLPLSRVREAMGVSRRTLHRHLQREVEQPVKAAIRLRLTIEELVRAQTTGVSQAAFATPIW